MIPPDLVYFVRPGDRNEELRYSLRSVEANMPHERIWIIGHTPAWVQNVTSIPGNRFGSRKWRNVPDNLRIACEEVTADEFVVMNDDFFVLEPTTELPPARRPVSLAQQVAALRGGGGSWKSSLVHTLALLRRLGIEDPDSYELHVPVVMERAKLHMAIGIIQLNRNDDLPQWRTVYGNLFVSEASPTPDVKVRRGKPQRSTFFLSSDDRSFSYTVQANLEALFPTPSRYERPDWTAPEARAARLWRSHRRILADDGGTSMNRVLFTSTTHAGLAVKIDGRLYKFTGGRLSVSPEAAEKIRDFADRKPQYQITEIVPEEQPAPAEPESDAVDLMLTAPADPLDRAGMQAALRAIGEPATGTNNELAARLAAAQGEPT